mmetsp:Transcript_68877/g.124169  ORF Transcript_68877/g.124169 Transcript_68877/m.124169 type:complete len:118 (-) Transcript_68877:15-368(-)
MSGNNESQMSMALALRSSSFRLSYRPVWASGIGLCNIEPRIATPRSGADWGELEPETHPLVNAQLAARRARTTADAVRASARTGRLRIPVLRGMGAMLQTTSNARDTCAAQTLPAAL